MTPDTYGNIHVAVNMVLLALIEGLCLWGLWWVIEDFRTWALVSVPAFFVIAYIGHRLIPMLTGPVVDTLIRGKVDR